MKIIDCFNFFNEFDIIELRLNILYPYVDKFVIVESNVTHTGKSKPFYFDENKEKFDKFLDKIEIFKVTDTPQNFLSLPPSDDPSLQTIYKYIGETNYFNRENQTDYGRDFFQKECVLRPLVNFAKDEDIVFISDADEIPHTGIFDNLGKLDLQDKNYACLQNMYYYYLNVLKEINWSGTKFGLYKNIKNLSVNTLRNEKSMSTQVSPGGWHFSFMGGAEKVKTKLLAYSAKDMANDNVFNSIENNIKNNIDPFFRQHLTDVPIDKTYPKYILDNLETFQHLIKS